METTPVESPERHIRERSKNEIPPFGRRDEGPRGVQQTDELLKCGRPPRLVSGQV